MDKLGVGVGVGVEGVVEGDGDGLLLVGRSSHKDRPAPDEDDDLGEKDEEVMYEMDVKNKEEVSTRASRVLRRGEL